jgi:hypothetical protein
MEKTICPLQRTTTPIYNCARKGWGVVEERYDEAYYASAFQTNTLGSSRNANINHEVRTPTIWK